MSVMLHKSMVLICVIVFSFSKTTYYYITIRCLQSLITTLLAVSTWRWPDVRPSVHILMSSVFLCFWFLAYFISYIKKKKKKGLYFASISLTLTTFLFFFWFQIRLSDMWSCPFTSFLRTWKLGGAEVPLSAKTTNYRT